MSTAQTLLLGAIAGITIFIGLPMGRMQSLSPKLKSFFTATATGILLFLFWDVLTEAIDPSWTSENLSILFFALAAGSILYVVVELLNVCRTFGSKTLTAWGIVLGLVLGFATDFILVAAGV